MPPQTNGRTPAADPVFGFVLLDTGRCELTLHDGTVVGFRRPRFGEFRAAREALYERDRATLRLTAQANADIGEVPAKDTATQEERLEVAIVGKQRQEQLEWALTDLNAEWVTATLGPLADRGALPDADEWPPEMLTNQFIIDLVNHWRHVPLAHGGRQTQPQPLALQ